MGGMKKPENNAAYALLDVVLAIALFALAATGLISVMQGINETSSNFAFDRVVQNRLLSLLTEDEATRHWSDDVTGSGSRSEYHFSHLRRVI